MCYWKGVAVAVGNSVGSVVWSVTTPGGSQTLSPPTLVWPLNGSTSDATSLNVQWSSVTGATQYQVYFGTSAANLSLYTTVNAPAVNAPFYNLNAGATYYWKVVSVRRGNFGRR